MPFAALALFLMLVGVLLAPLALRGAEAVPVAVATLPESVPEPLPGPELGPPVPDLLAELPMELPPDVAAAAAAASQSCAPAVPDQFVSLMGKLTEPTKTKATSAPKLADLPQSRPKTVHGVTIIYGRNPTSKAPAKPSAVPQDVSRENGVRVVRGQD